MRLFIAVKLNGDFIKALTGMQNAFRNEGVRGNYSKPENLHITIAFLGEVKDCRSVLSAIEGVRFSPFEIKLCKTGSFGGVWWAGIEYSKELYDCAAKVRSALESAGIAFDGKKFSPHVTLIRKPDTVKMPEINVPAVKMTADRICLMRSDVISGIRVYTEVGAVKAPNNYKQ